MTLTDFITEPKSLLIAPAGHGKTYAIASCIKLCPMGEKQLILTHTHAGISSIKQKLQKLKVEDYKFDVVTISGFAQKIVHAFFGLEKLGIQQEDKNYFDAIMRKCIELLNKTSVQSVIKISYCGIYVDEYQDCNKNQHCLIMNLSQLLPSHLFGDPLQGIYDFDGERVDFEKDLINYTKFSILDTPWRWNIEGNTPRLGQKILAIRNTLLSNTANIKLNDDKNCHFRVFTIPSTQDGNYFKKIGAFLRSLEGSSILVIIPTYVDSQGIMRGGIDDRALLRKQFAINHHYNLIEAIDDRSFYSLAKETDNLFSSIRRAKKKIDRINEYLGKLRINKTDLNEWFGNNRVKNKRAPNDELANKLNETCLNFTSTPSAETLLSLLSVVTEKLKLSSRRPELLTTIKKSLRRSIQNEKSVYKNLCQLKNEIRIIGRKIEGRYIGTTLLTKGLEFDTVVILGADLIPDKRNFYVGISRACKDLYLITEKTELTLAE